MILRFLARRFFCDNSDCKRSIFAEQLPELAARRQRQTHRLNAALVDVGLECGGEPGRRLCAKLGVITSGDTILRRLRAIPPGERHAGNVIGVDDFAFRRGQRYGTIIIDHESGGVIDLLPDRTAATLQTWLAARPAAPTVVTRDRSGIYAKAIGTAAPDAVQVADRWHLLANCREALVRVLDRHHGPITDALAAVHLEASPPGAAEPALAASTSVITAITPPPAPLSKTQQHSIDRREKRLARYEQVLKLNQGGASQRDISRQMKMSRTQVTKLLGADNFPERAAKRRCRQVDEYRDPLRAQWDAGVRNAQELSEHIATLGYTGGPDMVRRFVSPWRTDAERQRLSGAKPLPQIAIPLKLQRPGSHHLSWLLLKEELIPHLAEQALIARLRENCEPIRVASDLARSFGDVVRKRDIGGLTAWMAQAVQAVICKEVKGFAEGLLKNWSEVQAAILLPWSNGRTEGHVNRLKLIKRKMYGRAQLDLLRIRVLASGP